MTRYPDYLMFFNKSDIDYNFFSKAQFLADNPLCLAEDNIFHQSLINFMNFGIDYFSNISDSCIEDPSYQQKKKNLAEITEELFFAMAMIQELESFQENVKQRRYLPFVLEGIKKKFPK